MIVKTILLLAFFAITIGIGIYCRRKATNVSQFVLGGRSIGPWMTAFAYGTTYFSAVIFVGYAGQFGWKYGIASTWIGIGNALIGSMVAWLVLARRTRVMTHHLGSATMPDFFEKRYNSKNLKLAASAILFVFMIPYTASLYNGLSRIFGMAFNIDYAVCIIVMAVLTGIYVIVGGYALAFLGAPRYTGDLDLFVKADRKNALKILSALKSFGFGSLKLSESDFSEPGNVIQLDTVLVPCSLITTQYIKYG